MKRTLFVAIGVAVAAGAAGLAWHHTTEPVISGGPRVGTGPEESPAAAAPKPEPRQASKAKPGQAPDFTLKDLSGKHVTLSDYRGRIVIIDFWATWCGPCIQSMPMIDRVANRHSKAVKVLSVNQQERSEKVAEFARTKLSKAPHILLDEVGEVSRAYRVYGIPMIFVIDKEGVVRQRLTGFRPDLELLLERILDPLLKEDKE